MRRAEIATGSLWVGLILIIASVFIDGLSGSDAWRFASLFPGIALIIVAAVLNHIERNRRW